jgi:hypothetical protein
MILAVSDVYFSLSDIHFTTHSITTNVTMRAEGPAWSITSVYGPQDEHEKRDLIDELRGLKNVVLDAWLLLGNFNLITKSYLTQIRGFSWHKNEIK